MEIICSNSFHKPDRVDKYLKSKVGNGVHGSDLARKVCFMIWYCGVYLTTGRSKSRNIIAWK